MMNVVPSANFALHFNCPAVRMDELFCDCQPQSAVVRSLRDLSPRQKRSKMKGRSSEAMPEPVSLTMIRTLSSRDLEPDSVSMEIVPPSGVWRKAFDMRLDST